MGQGRPPGTTVFVGNISYDTSEEKLKEVFSQAGNVVSFRLLYDPNTGRAKGYGFCEYEDKETAMSARRNLNGTVVNGRPLRVDLTDSDKQFAAANGLALTSSSLPSSQTTAASTPSMNGSSPGDGTPNIPIAGGAPSSNASDVNSASGSQTQLHSMLPPQLASANPSMAFMSPAEIHQAMVYLKKAVVQYPNEMRELLTAKPRLAHAILQGQIMLGMIPPPVMPPPPPPPPPPPTSETGSLPALTASRPPPPLHPLPPPTGHRAPGPLPPQNLPSPPQQEALPHAGRGHSLQNMLLPPLPNGPPLPIMPNVASHPDNVVQQSLPLRPLPPNQQLPSLLQSDDMMDEQTAILSRVINLTPQEIEELAPEHRQYVLQLKQIVGMNNAQAMHSRPPMPPGQIGGRPPLPLPPQQRQPYR